MAVKEVGTLPLSGLLGLGLRRKHLPWRTFLDVPTEPAERSSSLHVPMAQVGSSAIRAKSYDWVRKQGKRRRRTSVSVRNVVDMRFRQ